jgi:Fe-S oxidoreductase
VLRLRRQLQRRAARDVPPRAGPQDGAHPSGAETVATGNPGCLWQLRLGAHERGLSVRVVHPIELLAEAYGQAARQR